MPVDQVGSACGEAEWGTLNEFGRYAMGLPAALLLTACGADNSGAPSTSAVATTEPAAVAVTTTVAPTAQGPRPKKWIDLQVGDCLADTLPWYQSARPSHKGYADRQQELELAGRFA